MSNTSHKAFNNTKQLTTNAPGSLQPPPPPNTLSIKEPYQLGRQGGGSQPALQENGCRILKKGGALRRTFTH